MIQTLKTNKILRLIILYNLIICIGFVILFQIFKLFVHDTLNANGILTSIFVAAWILTLGIGIYLTFLFILSIIGFFIAKHYNKIEHKTALKIQLWIILCLMIIFSIVYFAHL